MLNCVTDGQRLIGVIKLFAVIKIKLTPVFIFFSFYNYFIFS